MNLTRLEAVNRILRAAGEHPVSSLGSTTINDTLMAEQVLDEVNLREQMTGWNINTTIQEYTPDSGNNYRILLPDTTISVQTDEKDVNINVAHKIDGGESLAYDVLNSTASWDETDTLVLRVTILVPFEELPSQIQFSIADQAAVEYQMAVHGSPTLDQTLTNRAARSRAIARAYDIRTRPNNQFNDGRSSGPAMGRAVPRNWPWGWGRSQRRN